MSSELPLSAGVIADHVAQLRKAVSQAEDGLNRLRSELEWWETGQQLFGGASEAPASELPLEDTSNDEAASNGAKPTLRNAILTVLGQEPRKTWPADAVIAELRHRDWFPGGENGEHHVRSMLAQMHRKGQARKMGRGMYRLPPERKDST